MYRKGRVSWLKHLDFIIWDVVCLHLALVIGYIGWKGLENPYATQVYQHIAVVFTLIDLVVAVAFSSYKDVLRRGYYIEIVSTIKHVAVVMAAAVLYLFLVEKSAQYSRGVFVIMAGSYLVLLYLMRILWKKVVRNKREKKNSRALLIVADKANVESVIGSIQKRNFGMYRLAGLVITDEDMTGQVIKDIPVVSSLEDAADYVCREWIDEILIQVSQNTEELNKIYNHFNEMGVVVHLALTNTNQIVGSKQFVEKICDINVLTTTISSATDRQLFMKRCIDIAVGLAGTLVTGLLTLILGPIIKIKSPGPIFFSQDRIGKNGKKFKIYKFRSMYMDAEERKKELMAQNEIKDGMMFKMEFDPRIIGSKILPDGTLKKGIGNYIRDFSLDEFPQFLNVLKGDMSFVGTRPPTVDEWEKYQYHHRARLAVKPGITGMWQVSGRSNIKDFEEVVKLDVQYITDWSMGLEFRIMFKTVAVVFKKEGSM